MQVIDFVNVAEETVTVAIQDVEGRDLYNGGVLYTPFAYLRANVQKIEQGNAFIILYIDFEPATAEEEQ